jgi:hypothetical protein
MKFLICMFAMLLGSQMAAVEIVKLSDLKQEMVEKFAEGKRDDLIVECKEGTSLPLKIDLKGQCLALESAPLNLKVLKSCYIRCQGDKEFLFSSDLLTWKNFGDFFTGELKLSVGPEAEGVLARLQLELNQR